MSENIFSLSLHWIDDSVAKGIWGSAASSFRAQVAFPHCTPPPTCCLSFLSSESRSSPRICRFSWIPPWLYLLLCKFWLLYPMVSSLQLLSILFLYFLYFEISSLLVAPLILFALGCFSLKNDLLSFLGRREEINIYTQSSILNQKSVSRFSNI